MEESSSPVPCRWPGKWQKKEEKTKKSDFFSRQNRQKSGKNPAKTAQNPGKMTEKRRQNTGGGHHRPGAGRAELVTACHRFDPARGGRRGAIRPASSGGGRGIIGPARPVRGDLSSGAGCRCPLLYDYVGRGGARSPTGAGIIGPARGGGGAWPVQRSAAGGRGIICPARPVRGNLSSGAGCCCPLPYSYVGRGGVRSPTGAGIIGPARGGACPAFNGGGVRSPTGAGIIEPPRESRPRKTPHGKGQQKKR